MVFRRLAGHIPCPASQKGGFGRIGGNFQQSLQIRRNGDAACQRLPRHALHQLGKGPIHMGGLADQHKRCVQGTAIVFQGRLPLRQARPSAFRQGVTATARSKSRFFRRSQQPSGLHAFEQTVYAGLVRNRALPQGQCPQPLQQRVAVLCAMGQQAHNHGLHKTLQRTARTGASRKIQFFHDSASIVD